MVWLLLAGDILMLILFALMGQSEHKTYTTFQGTLETAAPFVIAWLIVGLVLGLYKLQHYRSFASMFKRTLIVWILAIPFGMMLRNLYLNSALKIPFLIVALVSTLILLSIWRIIFVWIYNRRNA
ncbi:DUF3054 domain-containing protein [Effusibacillus lacus]|uniref:DUF3054 domain-containing protein n=1 Tax=Effusibacillus lacus TaxID=1348429 RepID=A0A292YHP4_9BACL|nr:DUF3054 domain-containing protein [Effusibacillus lacus]TCS74635.1 DUF3054 family protein [Effusibacillus lacus]GAX88506.1 hypothetical protein EFBL_0115 [Effusibacillus lacus]